MHWHHLNHLSLITFAVEGANWQKPPMSHSHPILKVHDDESLRLVLVRSIAHSEHHVQGAYTAPSSLQHGPVQTEHARTQNQPIEASTRVAAIIHGRSPAVRGLPTGPVLQGSGAARLHRPPEWQQCHLCGSQQ